MTAVTPQQLTAALRRAGVLDRGEVAGVAIENARDTLISHVARLRVTYAGAADGAPLHVFFKTKLATAEPSWQRLGRKEVSFYDTVAPATPPGLLTRCYDAVIEDDDWHLLLEDLTATHEVMTDWPLPPPLPRWWQILEAHARFHAVWWNDARLATLVGGFMDESGVLDRSVEDLPKSFAQFADRLGDRLAPDRRRVYERLIEAAPRLLERYRSHRHMTIVHGDSHVWNALVPRDAGLDDVRLIDWDSARVDTSSDDLSYMMALHWFPDWRRRHEQESLRRYHDALVAHGVRDYSFAALEDDYRLSVMWQITTPMWHANNKIPAGVWWNHLERSMAAVHDLGCLDLLD